MKKHVLVLIVLLLILNVPIFAKNICVYPKTDEINYYLTTYFPSDSYSIKEYSKEIDVDNLISGDHRLMEYICMNSESDVLIIPIKKQLSGFNYIRLYLYENNTFTKVYESLNKDSSEFPKEVLLKLYHLVSDKQYGFLSLNNFDMDTSVLIDGKRMPAIDNYYLVSEGKHDLSIVFSGREVQKQNIYVENNTVTNIVLTDIEHDPVKVSVELNVREINDINEYEKRQKNFYMSFTRTFLLFGAMSATRSSALLSSNSQKIADYAFIGAIAASALNMTFDIVKYYRSIKNVAP